MKNIFLFIATFLIYSTTWSQDVEKDNLHKLLWTSSYSEALKKAKDEDKPLLIYFKGSDWCQPCKKLDKELFSTDKFANLSKDNFVMYEADIPFQEDLIEKEKLAFNKKLAKKYRVSSYPTILFVDQRQKVIASKKGLILTEYYYMFFNSVINKNRG